MTDPDSNKQDPAVADSARRPSDKAMQGEGNYDAAREFDAEQEQFAADKDKVAKAAREAADALAGKEGRDLADAEKAAAKGQTQQKPA